MAFHQSAAPAPLLLVHCPENSEYSALLANALQKVAATTVRGLFGGDYHIDQHTIMWQPAVTGDEAFASHGDVHYADWVEPEQLFGCVRNFQGKLTLQPGLVHQANGGTLILPLRALLAQPQMWLRLKQMIAQRRFDWLSADETHPLPVSVPSMPLQLKLILSADRDCLADFQTMEPELSSVAIYSEFEESLLVDSEESLELWCQWVTQIARLATLPAITADFWPVLINESVRYTGDKTLLPLCPLWLSHQLREAASQGNKLDADNLRRALHTREWRENYLADRIHEDILSDQVLIETEGSVIGQINGLSVVEFPGHPRAFGEPSRITCVVHPGDGEFMDIERKVELGGNIHAKGMMIMQAFLTAELQLEQQLPFSASIVFEQSYSEVDGDSASLAELCALISAMASQPINQQIAVTGSVDQFGNVQPVGGLNEKIEGFFHICQQRHLTGKQGVIIPATNARHLCLQQTVVDAVREQQFTIWTVNHVTDALPLLTGAVWESESTPCLLRTIQERIAQFHQQDSRPRPWPLRWLNGFGGS